MSELKPKAGDSDDLSEAAVRKLLAARAAARRAVPLDQLWIRVDSQVPSHPRVTGEGGVSIITEEPDDFVEISAVAGGKRVPLVSFSLFNELRSVSHSGGSSTWQRTFTTRIEGGRRISITIRPTESPDGSPAYELVARPVPGRSFVAMVATLPKLQQVGVGLATACVIGVIALVIWKVANNFIRGPESPIEQAVDERPSPSGTIITTQTPTADSSPTPFGTPSVAQQDEVSPQQSPTPPPLGEGVNNAQVASGIVDPGLPRGLRDLPRDISSVVSAALNNPGGFTVDPRREPPARRFTLMGSSEARAFRLKGPLGVVVRDERPTFTWEAPSEPGAHEYSVVVRDLDTDTIVDSTEEPVRGTSWTPKKPLPRGKSYGWFVSTTKGGETTYAPAAGLGTFKVLDQEAVQLLTRAEKAAPRSLLVRAVLLYRVGLIQEAAEAFTQLENLNPNSRTIKALRKRVDESRISK